MQRFIILVILILGVEIHAQATTFYISPTGNNTNAGNSAVKPWKTFSFALPRLQPGDTLVLMNGTYKGNSTGYPNINCASNAKNGTAMKPITIKAQNERQAFLQGDGSTRPFQIVNCSYWNVEGLRAESGDFQNEAGGGSAGHVFSGLNSFNLIFKNNLGAKNNRYKNSHIFRCYNCSYVLYEGNEAYYFHRHGFSFQNTSFITMRRNYANSRGYARIAGGYDGHGGIAANRGDEGFAAYGAPNCILENNISEGNEVIQATGSRDKILGNISMSEVRCFRVGHKDNEEDMADSILSKNNVCLNPIQNGFVHESPGGTVSTLRPLVSENNTVVGANVIGMIIGNELDKDYLCGGECPCPEKGNFCGDTKPDIMVTNLLTIHNGTGIKVEYKDDFSTLVLDYINSAGNIINYGVGTDKKTNSKTVVPTGLYNPTTKQGCIVYIPNLSNMKGAGKNGADIGANVIFRYENGVLTNKKLWNQFTGQFPCGIQIKGINDDATFPNSSCVNVHKRLNIGVNGCPIP